jgi:hypothetical protein
MFTMRVFAVTAFGVEATQLSSMSQGATFNQCITITDFETMDLDDDITLQERDANNCCPTGTVPGAWLQNEYQAAQVVCGFSADGTVTRNVGDTSACTYGTCYIYKQNLDCADDSKQRLNGCCGTTTGTGSGNRLGFHEDINCLGYELNFNNVHGEEVQQCSSYHEMYSTCGNKGTSATADDIDDSVLQITNIYEYTRCATGTVTAGSTDGCPSASGNSGGGGSGTDDNAAVRVGIQGVLAGFFVQFAF